MVHIRAAMIDGFTDLQKYFILNDVNSAPFSIY